MFYQALFDLLSFFKESTWRGRHHKKFRETIRTMFFQIIIACCRCSLTKKIDDSVYVVETRERARTSYSFILTRQEKSYFRMRDCHQTSYSTSYLPNYAGRYEAKTIAEIAAIWIFHTVSLEFIFRRQAALLKLTRLASFPFTEWYETCFCDLPSTFSIRLWHTFVIFQGF